MGGPNIGTKVLIRGKQKDPKEREDGRIEAEEKGCFKDGGRGRSRGCTLAAASWKGQAALKGVTASPADRFPSGATDSGLRTPRTVSGLFSATKLVLICYSSTWKKTHLPAPTVIRSGAG